MTDQAFAPIERRDADYMEASLAFGRRRLGETGSNPAVGALLVKNETIVGRGATERGGRPHAETEALGQSGEAARGATLYVTLEPCSHHGKTPPCAEAVIAAGVARVVSAMQDPDPRVAGAGHRMLAEQGIELLVGVGRKRAYRAHRGHVMRVTEGRPMLTLKLAQTADGFAAGDAHDPRLRITGAAAELRVHVLRATHDAVMLGIGTIVADDALLTVRLPGMEDRRPLRIVLDPHARLPLASRLAATAKDWPTLIVVAETAPQAAMARLESTGAEVARAPSLGSEKLDLRSAMRMFAERGLSRIFCEGGPTLASALILSGLADEFLLFHGQKPFGRPGLPALTKAARAVLADRALWRPMDAGFAGADRWESFERSGACLQGS